MEEMILKTLVTQGPLVCFMLLVIRNQRESNETLLKSAEAIQEQRFQAMEKHIEKLEQRSEKLEQRSATCEADRLRMQEEISELKQQRTK